VKFISAPAATAANLPFSQVVKVRRTLYLSGALGNVAGKMELAPGGIEAETKRMMQNIGETLTLAGSGYDKIFKCVVYLADMKEWATFNSVYSTYFQPGKFPARTAIGVNELIMGARVEMECWAIAAAAPKAAKAKRGKAAAGKGAKAAAVAKRRRRNKKKRKAND
jgi:reactive intermediate/imine deaminase